MNRTAITLAASALLAAPAFASDIVSRTSPHDVATTVAKLTAAIEKSPATLFTTVDHAAGAAKAGLEMAPATLVIFGNPKIGTPIMKAAPGAGLDLPIRVLVRAQGEGSVLETTAVSALRARHGIEEGADEAADKAFAAMEGAVTKLMEAATR